MSNKFQNEVALAEKIVKPRAGDCPYTLFLGAGASVSSGIPSTEGFIKIWKRSLYKELVDNRVEINEDKYNRWEINGYNDWYEENIRGKGDTEYSILFNHFYHESKERQIFIEMELDGKKPTFGYLYLSGLIAANRFNKILTTNFDDLLHDALFRFYNIRPIVCAFDSAVSGVRIASLRPKIIKLHGDFLFDNLRNMKHELKSLDTNMEEKMYEMCKDSGIIVIGYGGNDESIMAPIRDMLRKTEYLNLGLHWCVMSEEDNKKKKAHENDSSKALEDKLPQKLLDLVNNYGERIHLYEIKNFDYLMEVMFLRCNCSLPDTFTKPWSHNILIDFRKTVADESTEFATDYMKKILATITESASHVDQTQFNIFKMEDLFLEGEEDRKQKNFDSAKQNLSKCIEIIDEINKNAEEVGLKVEQRLEVYKRRCGVYLSKAQIAFDEGQNEECKENLNIAVDIAQDSIRFCREIDTSSTKPTYIRMIYYNACCAYALQGQILGDLSAKNVEDVFNYLKEIKKLDPEGIDIRDIKKDEDFKYFLDKYKTQIEEILK